MCKNVFRFQLGQALTLTEVNPYYDSSLTKEFNLESGQKFFRESLSGKLTFVKVDYDFIMNKPFEHQFIIHIDKLQSNGTYLTDWFIGEFTKTDCNFDEDEKKIEVTPKPFDKYKKVVDSMDKEFNLIDLSPDVVPVKATLQPLLQIFTPFSNSLTNVLSGYQFEQPITQEPFLQNLIDIHKFTLSKQLLFVPGDATVLNPDVSGEYDANFRSKNNQFQFITVGFGNVNLPSQTDDPDGLAESNFIVAGSTLTDEDFLSIWSVDGNQFEYIGTEIVDGIPNLGFRGLNGDSAPDSGTLTHVSGATNTTDLIYSAYDNSVVRQRWGLWWENPTAGNSQKYLFLEGMQKPIPTLFVDNRRKFSTIFNPINGSIGNFQYFSDLVYTRVLTNQDTFDGNPTFDIPEGDIVASHGRYSKVIGIEHTGFQAFDGHQIEHSKYGRFSDSSPVFANEFFVKPLVAATGQQIPFNLSEWTGCSWWLLFTPALQATLEAGNETYFLNDCYKLQSVVKSFLREIDLSLTHEEDSNHSEFFNSVNAIRGEIKVPVITPKSNAIVGNYDKPARKANIRFADVIELLRNFYQAYFYITTNDEFKIEHVDFFDRGLTYSGTNVNTDLNSLLEPKTKKPWSYKTKKYTFEKSALPELISFSWMDETSIPFDGVPIKMLSAYAEKGNLDKRSMSRFTSDIDFIHSQGSNISTDGFAFFEAVLVGNVLELPFLELTVDGDVFKLQNGFASMFFAASVYWLFDLPAIDVNLNYEDTTATTVKKTKIQELDLPSVEDQDPLKLFVSSLGVGSITKMSINLSSGSVKITLKHVTE